MTLIDCASYWDIPGVLWHFPCATWHEAVVCITLACFSAGLPFRGAHLLFPVDLNMNLEAAGPALHASIAGPLLYTQLSPAGIGGLRKLAMSYKQDSLVRIPLTALWNAR